MLSQKNKHCRDENVKYCEETHTYRVIIDITISVSKLIHLCFPEFNKEEIAKKKAIDLNKSVSEIYEEWDELKKKGVEYHKMIENYLIYLIHNIG